MDQESNVRRRRFLGAAAMTITAARLDARSTARPQSGPAPAFAALKQIDAGALNIGYVDAGRIGRPPVILLHGWPYDVHSYVDVVPLLESNGYRVIVPYLRGYGTTRFLASDTPRNGQQVALAADVIAFLDALAIDKAIVAGFDWGARTANIVAALWPERCKGMVSVSGYLIGSREANKAPLPPQAEFQWWYQYYFATERGRAGYDKYVRRSDSAFMRPPSMCHCIHRTYRGRRPTATSISSAACT
jgi:pimeloyl-ACP methyl ester carboxylesterase